MTEAERRRCRRIQDRIVKLAEQLGYGDGASVSHLLPSSVTVGDVRNFLFPQHQGEFRRILEEWRIG